MQVILFIGIQASGKSTFCKKNFFDTHVHISLDLVKTRHREKRLIETCLEIGQAFVIDNTNPTIEERKRYIEIAKVEQFSVIGYYFESKIEDCMERNWKRAEKHIPEKGIRGTHARLEIPKYEEGYDQLYYVKIIDDQFLVELWKNEV